MNVCRSLLGYVNFYCFYIEVCLVNLPYRDLSMLFTRHRHFVIWLVIFTCYHDLPDSVLLIYFGHNLPETRPLRRRYCNAQVYAQTQLNSLFLSLSISGGTIIDGLHVLSQTRGCNTANYPTPGCYRGFLDRKTQ